MKWLISLIAALASSAFLKPFLTRCVVLLGISVVTYGSVSIGVAAVWSSVSSNFSSLPVELVSVLTMMKIPQAFNVLISAYAGALAVRGLTSAGSLKRAVWRPGQSGDLFGAG
jgi:hypothetical protein